MPCKGTKLELSLGLQNVNVNVNVETAMAKRLAVQIMNLDTIHETKTFLADDEKQSEKRKR